MRAPTILALSALSILLLSGCSPCRRLVSTSGTDSTRVEIRTRQVLVRDTVLLEIPAQSEKVATRDTVSHLENDYARSDARIDADGTLFHTLSTKPQRRPMPLLRPVEYRDSIAYRDRREVVTEQVNVLTHWQRLQIRGFWILLALTALVAGLRIRRLV